MNILKKISFIIIVLFLLASCSQNVDKQYVIVFHAGSLSVPFKEIAKEFEKENPNVKILLEPDGSRKCARKITDLNKKCDIMASADYTVINKLLIPEHAKWNIKFASNEMTIVYHEASKYANEINANNWTKVFLRDGVKVGHSNPNMDPCGYRSMLVTKLAEKYYKQDGFFKKLLGYGDSYTVGEENPAKIIVRPKETDLLGLIEVNAFDYLFIYKSVAEQHGLQYITLPKEISLKDNEFKNFYNSVSFKIDGKKPGSFSIKKGASMVYGITIAQNSTSPINKVGAIKFVNFVLSNEGQSIMKENGQGIINPPIFSGNTEILGK